MRLESRVIDMFPVERKCFKLHKIMTGLRFKCWLVAYTEVYSDGTSRHSTREFDTLTKAKRFRKEEKFHP